MAKEKNNKRQSQFIPIEKCRPNIWNPREMNEREFKSLRVSLKKYGQTKPIQVRAVKDGYEIVGGYHTWKGLKELGAKEIEVNITKLNDDEARLFSLQDNIHGQDQILKLGKLVFELNQRGYALKKIAEAVGKEEQELKDALDIVKLEIEGKMKKLKEELKKENLVEISFITDKDPRQSMKTFIEEVKAFAHSKGVEVESVKEKINKNRITVALITFNVTGPQNKTVEKALQNIMKKDEISKVEALVKICSSFA